jgi:hypothetical protein
MICARTIARYRSAGFLLIPGHKAVDRPHGHKRQAEVDESGQHAAAQDPAYAFLCLDANPKMTFQVSGLIFWF